MISDILSRAVVELDHYLTVPKFAGTFTGELQERITRLRDDANNLRAVLDIPPAEIPSAPDHKQQTDPKRSRLIAAMMLDDPAVDLRTPCFSQSDLLKRGWSMRLIEQLLGRRDWEAPNPHGANFAPMLCWRKDRVRKAEETVAFQDRS